MTSGHEPRRRRWSSDSARRKPDVDDAEDWLAGYRPDPAGEPDAFPSSARRAMPDAGLPDDPTGTWSAPPAPAPAPPSAPSPAPEPPARSWSAPPAPEPSSGSWRVLEPPTRSRRSRDEPTWPPLDPEPPTRSRRPDREPPPDL